MASSRLSAGLLAVVAAVFVWSGVRPLDRFTWALEVAPAVIGVGLLAALYPRVRLTALASQLVAAHAVILMVGGHYTYAEVPLFDWLRDALGLARNHYDRVGHFAQGFVPAILAREVLLRARVVRPGGWTTFLAACVALSISAFYELIEWWVALATGQAAEAFLGTQGDVWDTQWDMALALTGALAALLLLRRRHDRQLRDCASVRP